MRLGASAFLILFVIGVTAPTYADPGDNGKGSENSAASEHSNAGGNGKGSNKSDSSSGSDQVEVTVETQSSGSQGNSSGNQGGTSGDTDSPQPNSNADQNKGGANGQCPGGKFCSTRDGSESKNGNGKGHAYGKPCAGCVGKADNKNPPGQVKKDHDNGYECDGNNGVGKTNPAHTGCKPKPPVKPPAEQPEKPPAEQPEKPPAKPPVKPPAEQPEQPPVSQPEQPPAVAPVQQEAPRAPAFVAPTQAVLPPTGAGSLETALGVGGAVTLLSGLYLLAARRRRTN